MVHILQVSITNGGQNTHLVGWYKTLQILVEGGFKHSLRSFPRVLLLPIPFLLDNKDSKKLVLLILPEGKKWSLHIRKGDYSGKMWENNTTKWGNKCGEGIIPHLSTP